MRAFFLAIIVAVGLTGCTQFGFEPDNADVNSNIIYTDAGGGNE